MKLQEVRKVAEKEVEELKKNLVELLKKPFQGYAFSLEEKNQLIKESKVAGSFPLKEEELKAIQELNYHDVYNESVESLAKEAAEAVFEDAEASCTLNDNGILKFELKIKQ
ncbi:MAG: hypothetical protein J6A04_07285 [Clostridia bacterium]|nr:hypothetical protein [Clostridia bacterium]